MAGRTEERSEPATSDAQRPGDGRPLAYRPVDAAAALGISRAKLYELMHDGRIVARKLDRRTLIPREELERYLADLPAWEEPKSP